jgi:hypothetical protein
MIPRDPPEKSAATKYGTLTLDFVSNVHPILSGLFVTCAPWPYEVAQVETELIFHCGRSKNRTWDLVIISDAL